MQLHVLLEWVLPLGIDSILNFCSLTISLPGHLCYKPTFTSRGNPSKGWLSGCTVIAAKASFGHAQVIGTRITCRQLLVFEVVTMFVLCRCRRTLRMNHKYFYLEWNQRHLCIIVFCPLIRYLGSLYLRHVPLEYRLNTIIRERAQLSCKHDSY